MMKALLLLLAFDSASSIGQIAVSIQPADQALIPGSIRSVYAKVEGTSNLEVRWSATGGCTLQYASTSAVPERVQAPDRGGTCKLTKTALTNETPTFSSTVSCRITAASVADSSKTASIVLPVCSPEVTLNIFPASTVLYKGQFAVIQSDLRGNVNTSVLWSLTANPGAAGTLTNGNTNRHAIFSASAPGTYVLTATSTADPRRKASSTIYVTAHDLPAPVAASHTEPVDCTAVGKGKVFEVGPAHPLHDLNAVPWGRLQRGDTVRIHNDDTTGRSPSVYHQHISIAATGTADQPVRICGVPDAQGVKPILDGDNASSPKDNDWAGGWLEDLGLIMIYDAPHKYDSTPDNNRNILIEGLHLRNVTPAFKFVRQRDGTSVPYNAGASCIHVHNGREVMIRGNELENCSQAIFANSQTPAGSMVYDLTVEGNYLREWGLTGSYYVHGMYLQAVGLAVQFNYFGTSAAGAMGNAIKSRSVLNFLRWNYISQPVVSTARAFDLVEPQAFECYVNPYSFAYYHSPGNNACIPPHDGADSDPVGPDQVAANFEAYHSDYIYGNVLDDVGSEVAFVHYGYDQQVEQAPAYIRRGGTLYYWNNTHFVHKSNGLKTIFDPSSPDIKGSSYEFPSIESLNNVFAANGATTYQWVQALWARVIVDANWMKPGFSLPDRESQDTYQGGVPAALVASCGNYGRCHPGNGHLEWGRGGKPGSMSASLYTGPVPFAPETFLPTEKIRGLAAPLPPAIHDQPSNMRLYPATSVIAPAKDMSFLGALE